MSKFSETNTMTDLHGYLDATKAVLRAQGYIDKNDKWIAENKRLVLLGDYVDRGPDSVELFKYFYYLQQEVGPEVLTMTFGNHDIQYFGGPDCGIDQEVDREISSLMRDHARSGDLQAATIIENGDKRWLAVHGGLHPKHGLNNLPLEEIVEHLNKLGLEFANEGTHIPEIADVGFERAPYEARDIRKMIAQVEASPMTKVALQSMGPGRALKYMEDKGLLEGVRATVTTGMLKRMGISDVPGITWCDVNDNLDHENDLVPQVVGHRQQAEIGLKGKGKVLATNVPYGDAQSVAFHADGGITLSPRWRQSMNGLDYDVPSLNDPEIDSFSH